MKQIVVISIFFCCLLQIIQTKQELEIGVINFEEAKGAQIYNQLVRFDNPFTKLPQVALALIDHTPTNALFAKVKNVTNQDFIIQFFSANTLNATYRYLATTDNSIYMNCSNYKASQFAQFKYPQFENQIQTIAFLSGYHHTGFIKLEVQEFNNKAAKLAIKSNDIKQTAVGICFIAGYGFSLNSDNKGPKFSGRIDSEGMSQQITFIQKGLITQASYKGTDISFNR